MTEVKKVLVVDDDIDFAESLRELLELDGHCVAAAFSGTEAAEMFEAEAFDVIILDIRLGDQDGLEFLKRFAGQRPDVKYLVVTGYNADQYSNHVKGLGADGILQKPISAEMIREHLAG